MTDGRLDRVHELRQIVEGDHDFYRFDTEADRLGPPVRLASQSLTTAGRERRIRRLGKLPQLARPQPVGMPAPSAGPIVVKRCVSQSGSIMVATQRIHVGMTHARKIVTITAGDHSFQLDVDGETVGAVPRTTSSEVHRYKAYATRPRRL